MRGKAGGVKAGPPSLKAQALAMLARREHSRSELRDKLVASVRKRLRMQQARAAAAGSVGDAEAQPGEVDGEPAGAWDASVCVAQIDAVLDWLAERGLQSDARFVESRVHARSVGHGQARIRQELARHGLALDEQADQTLRGSEMARARALWLRRFGELAPDAASRARQMRFLAARGFSSEVVRKVVGGRDED